MILESKFKKLPTENLKISSSLRVGASSSAENYLALFISAKSRKNFEQKWDGQWWVLTELRGK